MDKYRLSLCEGPFQTQCKYVSCCVNISIQDKSTFWAYMDSFRQRLLNNLPASRAFLRRSCWIDKYNSSATPLRLIGSELAQLVPAGVHYCRCKRVVLNHVPDVQVFKDYRPVFLKKIV